MTTEELYAKGGNDSMNHVDFMFGTPDLRVTGIGADGQQTLIMENEAAKPLVILMHGDCEVSTKNLARQIGCKSVAPCKPEQAQRNSGYMVGGTSPFGTRKKMPVYVQKSILELDEIYINGGRRGFIVAISPTVLTEKLGAVPVDVALTD